MKNDTSRNAAWNEKELGRVIGDQLLAISYQKISY